MSDYAVSSGTASVKIERRLPGPIERVWSYLVDPEKRALWFAGGPKSELRVGAPLTFTFDHSKLSHEPTPDEWKAVEGYSASGQVTHFDPPRRFGYKGSWDGNETEVLFELEAIGNEVLLTITQSKIVDEKGKANYASGWHAHLNVLEARLKGVEPRGFWTDFNRLEKEYATRF